MSSPLPTLMEMDGNGCPYPPALYPDDHEMTIFLKVMRTISMTVKNSDTIEDVRARYLTMEKITPGHQEIPFLENRMHKKKTLAEYGMIDGSTLNMFIGTSVPLLLSIKILPNGKIILLDLKTSDTVMTIKYRIWEKENIPLNEQILICDGKALEDCLQISACNITGNSTLHLLTMPGDSLVIYVFIPSGKFLRLEVKCWYNVWCVKALIESKEQIPTYFQRLYFDKKKLEDSHTLLECRVSNHSVLGLTLRMQVLVKTLIGKTITLDVSKKDTIESVGEKIRKKVRLSNAVEFRLVFSGKPLVDSGRLEEYNITQGSTLHMVSLVRSMNSPAEDSYVEVV